MNGITNMASGVNIAEYSEHSRIWIYAASRNLTTEESFRITEALTKFTEQWTAHNERLNAKGWIEFDRILILMVDEDQANASGCSIDSSVRFLKEIGDTHGIDWFDRLTFYYEDGEGQVQSVKKDELRNLYELNTINDDTLFFNFLVKNKLEFKTNWKVPFRQSWQYKMM
jgi:hypothetical protein